MKKILCFTALLCIINHSFAQNNSDPWPINGNVGIGTTSPATALHVKTTSNTAGFSNLTIENSGATGNEAGIAFKGGYTTASLNSGRIYSLFDGGTSYSFARTTIQSMLVGGVYDNTFTVRNGSVGIGTTTPAGKLQVKMGNGTDLLANNNSVDIGVNGGTAGWARAFRVVNTSGSDGLDGGAFGVTGIGSTPTYAYMAIPTTEALGYASTKIIALNNLGNVGIGTITPASTLQVVGDARFGSNGIYTDLKISTQTPLSGYNQTNVVTPVTAPGSGNAKAALYLKSAGSVGINRMDLLVDGNMGIGTTAPISKLQVGVPTATGVTTPALSIDANIFGAYSATRSNLNIGTTDAAAADKGGMLTFSGESGQTSSPYYFGGIRGAKEGVGTYQGYLAFYTIPSNSILTERMRINAVGNIGIGTTTPSSPLSVVGTSNVSTVSILSTAGLATDNAGIVFGTGRTTVGYDGTYGGLKLAISDNSKPIIFGNSITAGAGEFARFTGTGNLGIGTTDTKTYKLAVNGSVIATSVTVKLYSDWPDYVFKKDYKLPTLVKVQEYIDKNGHLPDMPSEKEVADNGLNLGEMNKILTKKVEELTLYLIEQNKEMKELKERVLELEKSPR